jgi:hypothetical protein
LTRRRITRSALAWRLSIAVFALVGIWMFWQVSLASNDVPEDQAFPGWVAVVQPADATFGDQIALVTGLVPSGRRGGGPDINYSVVACGPHQFDGVLIAGGAARLTDPQHEGAVSVQDVPDLRFHDENRGGWVRLGPVQIVKMALPAQRCTAPFSTKSGAAQLFGLATGVVGKASASVEHRQHPLFGWEAPRWTQTWPLVGDPPGVLPAELGDWQFGGLAGTWVRPINEYLDVDGGGLPLGSSVESASPAVDTGAGLEWSATSPFQPIARVVDSDDQTAWQNRLVLATIWLTLGGALICSVLYDLVPKMRPESDEPARLGAPVARQFHDAGSPRAGTSRAEPVTRRAIAPESQKYPRTQIALTAAILMIALADRLRRRRGDAA